MQSVDSQLEQPIVIGFAPIRKRAKAGPTDQIPTKIIYRLQYRYLIFEMPDIIKSDIDHTTVIKYYEQSHRQYNSSEPAPELITRFGDPDTKWHLVELSEDEFFNLETPAGGDSTPPHHKLLKEVCFGCVYCGNPDFSKYKRPDVLMKLALLVKGEPIGPLIIRTLYEMPDRKDASFYIEDGFGKAVAIKQFIEWGNKFAVQAYCQVKEPS